jgi:multiple sugar transport system permease protein
MSTPTKTETTRGFDVSRLRSLWNEYLPYWFMTPIVLVMLLITVFPGVYDLYLSLVEYDLSSPSTMGQFAGLSNFQEAFSSAGAVHSFTITIGFVAGALILETGIGFALAALVSGVKSDRMLAFYRVAFILPMAVAPVSLATIFRIMLNTEVGVLPFLIGAYTPFAAPNFLKGERVYVEIPDSDVHLFDAETGETIHQRQLDEEAEVALEERLQAADSD